DARIISQVIAASRTEEPGPPPAPKSKRTLLTPLTSRQLRNQIAADTIPGATLCAAYGGKVADYKRPTPMERTLDIASIVAELKRDRDRLSRAIAALEGSYNTAAAGTKRRVRRRAALRFHQPFRPAQWPSHHRRLGRHRRRRL